VFLRIGFARLFFGEVFGDDVADRVFGDKRRFFGDVLGDRLCFGDTCLFLGDTRLLFEETCLFFGDIRLGLTTECVTCVRRNRFATCAERWCRGFELCECEEPRPGPVVGWYRFDELVCSFVFVVVPWDG